MALKKEEVWLIKRLLWFGVSQQVIAKMFKVSCYAVNRINTKKVWSNIKFTPNNKDKKLKEKWRYRNSFKDEVWIIIENFSDYAVSNYGRVKVIDNKFAKKPIGEFLKLTPNGDGYAMIDISNKQGKQTVKVHRLVALHFLGKPATKKYQVNHIDGNKLNNHVSNLEWVTHAENMRHAVVNGLKPTKLTKNDVIQIRKLLKQKNMTHKQIAKKFNVAQSIVARINTGTIWSCVS